MPAATVPTTGVEIHHETFGDPGAEPLLLVMGLGAQMTAWPVELCEALVDRGFHVIRFDNRDAGLSTKVTHDTEPVLPRLMAAFSGEAVDAPYLLTDLAADAVGLLDVLGIEAAHVVGASMGGMIAQTIAIEHPQRVTTLTSIMSTTGEPGVGQPTSEAMGTLMSPPPQDRDGIIEHLVATRRAIGSPVHFDEAAARRLSAEAHDRAWYPEGTSRQLLAIAASGDRADGLRSLDVPTLVVHGEADPLVTPSGGRRTAELVPGAELLLVEDMAHDLPLPLIPQIVERICQLASRAA